MKIHIPILLLSAFIAACKVSPEEIPYGNAECTYCRMNVVDRQHAAELVTQKGRIYFFDAIECMANYVAAEENGAYSHLMVNDFSNPGALISVDDAFFLISKQISSPMGANLSAFSSQDLITQMQLEAGGNIYDWNEIVALGRSGQL